jgi:hypothetical protein
MKDCPDCLGVVTVHNELTYLMHSPTCPLLARVDAARRVGQVIEIIDAQRPAQPRRTPRLVTPRVPTSETAIPRAIDQLFERFGLIAPDDGGGRSD